MNIFRKEKRGYIYIEAIGGGLLNKDQEYKGNFEVKILEETDKMCKIQFVDLPVYERQWVDKKSVTIITK